MKKCSVCGKKQVIGSGTFFSVPNDDRRIKWSKICSIDFSPRAIICIDHFAPFSIATLGQKRILLPNAVPIMNCNKLPDNCRDQGNATQQPSALKHMQRKKLDQQETIKQPHRESLLKPNVAPIKKNNGLQQKNADKRIFENQKRECKKETSLLLNSNKNAKSQPLQEDLNIEKAVLKSISSADSRQSNTRLCGLVQSLGLLDEFRLNCFYCSDSFPLQKWKIFVNHLREKHFEEEDSFKTSKNFYEDDDSSSVFLTQSMNDIKSQSLTDPLDPTANCLNQSTYSKPDENTEPSNNISITANAVMPISTKLSSSNKTVIKSKMSSGIFHLGVSDEQLSRPTALQRCLKRTEIDTGDLKINEVCESDSTEIVEQKSTEIVFEYTPRDIVELLLDSMKNYPVLWEFDDQPFNEDFFEAVEDLCKIINDKWSLNIDNLKMRRSINRIIRFYCYLYPNTNVENIDQFTCYYDKCAGFLPSAVNDIAYARCSHCYICYKNDFDLKRHLLEEQKYLQWPFKCVECKECFRENDDYEFHKRLPHYDEIFRCEPCNKTYFRRNRYNKHMTDCHPSDKKRGKYQCDICDRTYTTSSNLSAHKRYHGEKKFKCHLCPKSYFEKSKLTIHLKGHRNQFDYVCEICGKEFLIKKGLKVHMKKHTGEKVTCSICNLKLRKSSLRRHVTVVHKSSEITTEIAFKKRPMYYRRLIRKKPLAGNRKKGVERKYHCKVCDLNFENYKLIVEHNKELHFDNPKWPCKICSAEYNLKINLKKHYRRKHNLHVIQAYKLVDENEDLDVVLAFDKEQLKNLASALIETKNNQSSVISTNIEILTKSELLPDDLIIEDHQSYNSEIEDEIICDDDDDGIDPQEYLFKEI